jgi:hypothetical protein
MMLRRPMTGRIGWHPFESAISAEVNFRALLTDGVSELELARRRRVFSEVHIQHPAWSASLKQQGTGETRGLVRVRGRGLPFIRLGKPST